MKFEEKEYPDYLFHYTSIENLALILKNKTIRFNSLIDVDDPDEIKTSDTEGIGKYCYCSCWTDKDESIPFWSMYTKNMHGVMIKMEVFPFNEHNETLAYYNGGQEFKTYIPKDLFSAKNLIVIPTVPFLRKLEYSDKKDIKVFDMLEKKMMVITDFLLILRTLEKLKLKHGVFNQNGDILYLFYLMITMTRIF